MAIDRGAFAFWSFATLFLSAACGGQTEATTTGTSSADEALQIAVSRHSVAVEYADLDQLPAGVAGGNNIVFVGSPLEGRVLALSRFTARQRGELPSPPNGFVLPFIMHTLGPGKLGVLDAGGLPSPVPLIPANPSIYEYSYSDTPGTGFSAKLTRTVSFAGETVGFAEDFVPIGNGRYLLSDAILGSIWIVESDGTVQPGIVPKSFDPADRIPNLAFCPTMPEVTVGGVPFLFSGSTLPGVSPMAVRDGTVYFYSPCGEGLFTVPLASLFDHRQPFERAADIRLLAPKPSNVLAEELLEFSFNPFDPGDRYLYAANALELEVIRIDLRDGSRQVVGDNPRLFNFPSSLGFLPPVFGSSPLAVVSNQQQNTTLTNDAITQDQFQPPFIVTKVFLTGHQTE